MRRQREVAGWQCVRAGRWCERPREAGNVVALAQASSAAKYRPCTAAKYRRAKPTLPTSFHALLNDSMWADVGTDTIDWPYSTVVLVRGGCVHGW
jgi:hypothetical protein